MTSSAFGATSDSGVGSTRSCGGLDVRVRVALGVVTVAIAMIGVFSHASRLPFVADDYIYLDDVQQPRWWHSGRVWNVKGTPFRPVLFLWFWASHHLFGLHPLPYHLAAGIVVLIAGVTTALIARRLGLHRGAYVAAAVVCLHASMMTVIGWASAANSAIGMALALAALYCLLRPRVRVVEILLGVALFGIALLTREVVAVLPIIVFGARLVVDNESRFGNRLKRAVLVSLPLWVVAAIYAAVRHGSGFTSDAGPYAQKLSWHGFSNLHRLAEIATDAEPFRSSALYDSFVVVAWVVLIGSCVLAVRSRRWQGLFGIGWSLVAVLPVLFLVNHGMSYYYIDFALPGLAIAIGTAAEWATRRLSQHGRTVAVGAFLVAFTLLSYKTARVQERSPLRAEAYRGARVIAQVKRLNPYLPKGTTLRVRYSNPADLYLTAKGHAFRIVYHDPTLNVVYVYDPTYRVLGCVPYCGASAGARDRLRVGLRSG